jgi:hypothetical protein
MLALSQRACWIASALCIAVSSSSCASSKAGAKDEAEIRHFVSEFYDWYAKLQTQRFEGFTADAALRKRPTAFDAELARLLRRDFDAQSRCADIVGIDWDPIAGNQDPAERFLVGRILTSKRGHRVEVYGFHENARGAKPDVIAEVARVNGRWVFVDFFCPDCESLVEALKRPLPPCDDLPSRKR